MDNGQIPNWIYPYCNGQARVPPRQFFTEGGAELGESTRSFSLGLGADLCGPGEDMVRSGAECCGVVRKVAECCVCVFVCVSVCPFVGLSFFTVCLSVCLSGCLCVCLFVCLSICLFFCLSVSLFACLSVCLFVRLSGCLVAW